MNEEHVGVIEGNASKVGSIENRVARLEREVSYDGRSLGVLSGITALRFSHAQSEHEELRAEVQSLSSALGGAMLVSIGLCAVCIMLVNRIADIEDALDAMRRAPRAN